MVLLSQMVNTLKLIQYIPHNDSFQETLYQILSCLILFVTLAIPMLLFIGFDFMDKYYEFFCGKCDQCVKDRFITEMMSNYPDTTIHEYELINN